MGLEKMDEAEKLLLKGHDEISRSMLVVGLASFIQPNSKSKAKESNEHFVRARLKSVERLVEFYRKANNLSEKKKWESQRLELEESMLNETKTK